MLALLLAAPASGRLILLPPGPFSGQNTPVTQRLLLYTFPLLLASQGALPRLGCGFGGGEGITDHDGDGFGDSIDCDDGNPAVHPDAEERCDGIDNNCDESIDEAEAVNALTWYWDFDDDGFGNPEQETKLACDKPDYYAAVLGDCNDANADIHPGADELCDGLDNDCDDEFDEQAVDAREWHPDHDGDGYGDPDIVAVACVRPNGWVEDGTDCDDWRGEVRPGGRERCGNDQDDDCDGAVDEDDASDAHSWYVDGDGDGYGTESSVIACEQPKGYAALGGDCDDDDAAVNPGASEVCDGLDNDCDGEPDFNPVDGETWHEDGDGDGYGNAIISIATCTPPSSGYVSDGTDCDDSSAEVNPGADERCNQADDDCDGSIDEDDAVDASTWYIDSDGDGHGSEDQQLVQCIWPSGYTNNAADCDDTDPSIYPGAPEVLAGVDSNCDGTADVPWPVAVASYGNTGTLQTCEEIELDGSASYDPDGDPIVSYSWTLESAPSASVRDSDDIEERADEAPVFMPDEEGDFTFGLVVSDGTNDSPMDSLTLSVAYRGYNSAPMADAGTDYSYAESVSCVHSGYDTGSEALCDDCATVVFALSGSASSDDDGDDLSYSWAISAGGDYATLAGSQTETAYLVVSGVPATYGSTETQTIVVELQVQDCEGESSSDSVEVVFECTGI